jgi:cysteine desulfuration protein SufE
MKIPDSISVIQNQLASDFEYLEDWEERYAYLMDLGKEVQGLSPEEKTSENLIKGCQSLVWLTTRFENNRIWMKADSEAFIARGIIALLIKVFNGQTAVDILNETFDLPERIGLTAHLSPGRANGLAGMLSRIRRDAALALGAQNNN